MAISAAEALPVRGRFASQVCFCGSCSSSARLEGAPSSGGVEEVVDMPLRRGQRIVAAPSASAKRNTSCLSCLLQDTVVLREQARQEKHRTDEKDSWNSSQAVGAVRVR